MKALICSSLALAALLGVWSCSQKQASREPEHTQVGRAAPSWFKTVPELSHADVMQIFRQRGSAEEAARFDQLRATTDSDQRTSALEMVLWHLTKEELGKIGIHESTNSGTTYWTLAVWEDRPEVSTALEKGPSGLASSDGGVCSLNVEKKKFFKARQAILAVTNLQALGVQVANPLFDLE